MSVPTMQPRMMTTSMAADFFTVSTLESQTGFAEVWFPDVILKELLDNALDACETAGVPPSIAIAIDSRDERLVISVTDNGPGLDPETVRRIVDFSTRTSDKAVYRKPTRGAQGNALMTILGIVTALGAGQPLIIESRGVRHAIAARLRPGGVIDITHETSPCPRAPGTRMCAVVRGDDLWLDGQAWVRHFSLFNPHASFAVTEWQESDEDEPIAEDRTHAETS